MAGKKTGGGKLVRSEIVTIRLDPRLRYLADLAARKHRRTLSSFIEWAIEESLDRVDLRGAEGELSTVAQNSSQLWDPEEPDRFVFLATKFPDLLTHDEQFLWKYISTEPVLRGRKPLISDMIAIRESWNHLKRYSDAKITKEELNDIIKSYIKKHEEKQKEDIDENKDKVSKKVSLKTAPLDDFNIF